MPIQVFTFDIQTELVLMIHKSAAQRFSSFRIPSGSAKANP